MMHEWSLLGPLDNADYAAPVYALGHFMQHVAEVFERTWFIDVLFVSLGAILVTWVLRRLREVVG